MSHRFKAPKSLNHIDRKTRELASRIYTQEQLDRILNDGPTRLRRAAFDRIAPWVGFRNPKYTEPKGNHQDVERREQPAGNVDAAGSSPTRG